jgi:hypothetical protein
MIVYYLKHQEALDAYIAEEEAESKQLREEYAAHLPRQGTLWRVPKELNKKATSAGTGVKPTPTNIRDLILK